MVRSVNIRFGDEVEFDHGFVELRIHDALQSAPQFSLPGLDLALPGLPVLRLPVPFRQAPCNMPAHGIHAGTGSDRWA